MTDYRTRDIELALREALGSERPPNLLARVEHALSHGETPARSPGGAIDLGGDIDSGSSTSRIDLTRDQRVARSLGDSAAPDACEVSDNDDVAPAGIPSAQGAVHPMRRNWGVALAAASLVAGFVLILWPRDGNHDSPNDTAQTRQLPAPAPIGDITSPLPPQPKPELVHERLTVTSRDEAEALPLGATDVVGVDLDDDAVNALTRCAWLRELSLRACERLTDDGVAQLASLRRLERLDLYGCKSVGDAGLIPLSDIEKLAHLDLSYTGAGDGALESLSTLALTRMDICGCDAVTDKGLRWLAGCVTLEELFMWKCPRVTKAGLMAFAGHLNLRYLSLRGCDKLMDADIADLRAALPMCQIVN